MLIRIADEAQGVKTISEFRIRSRTVRIPAYDAPQKPGGLVWRVEREARRPKVCPGTGGTTHSTCSPIRWRGSVQHYIPRSPPKETVRGFLGVAREVLAWRTELEQSSALLFPASWTTQTVTHWVVLWKMFVAHLKSASLTTFPKWPIFNCGGLKVSPASGIWTWKRNDKLRIQWQVRRLQKNV